MASRLVPRARGGPPARPDLLDVLWALPPDELLVNLWQRLSRRERRGFLRLSRAARQLAHRHLVTAIRLQLDPAALPALLQRQQLAMHHYSRLQRLELPRERLCVSADECDQAAQLLALLAHGNTVTQLCLHTGSASTRSEDSHSPCLTTALAASLLQPLPHLRELRLEDFVSKDSPALAALAHCPRLTFLTIHGLAHDPPAVVQLPPGLTALKRLVLPAAIQEVQAGQLQLLTHLECDAPSEDCSHLCGVLAQASHLQHLTVPRGLHNHFPSGVVLAALGQNKSLRVLELPWTTAAAERCESLLALTGLQELKLTWISFPLVALPGAMSQCTKLGLKDYKSSGVCSASIPRILNVFSGVQDLRLGVYMRYSASEAWPQHLQATLQLTSRVPCVSLSLMLHKRDVEPACQMIGGYSHVVSVHVHLNEYWVDADMQHGVLQALQQVICLGLHPVDHVSDVGLLDLCQQLPHMRRLLLSTGHLDSRGVVPNLLAGPGSAAVLAPGLQGRQLEIGVSWSTVAAAEQQIDDLADVGCAGIRIIQNARWVMA